MRQQRTERSQGWVKVLAVLKKWGHFALQVTTIPKLRQVCVLVCRCKMRMSGLSKVEMSAFIDGRGRYGNGANCFEPTRTGPATRVARNEAEADHVERLLSFLPGSPASQCAAPFTILIPIALENLGGLISRAGPSRGNRFLLDYCKNQSFPSESSSESRLPHFSHTFPPARTAFEGVRVAAKEEYSGLRKSQWHKGGVELHEADSPDQQHAILAI